MAYMTGGLGRGQLATFSFKANGARAASFVGPDDSGLTLAYTPGKAFAYLNGRYLTWGKDWTGDGSIARIIDSNGLTVTLSDADQFEIVALSTFDLAKSQTVDQSDVRYLNNVSTKNAAFMIGAVTDVGKLFIYNGPAATAILPAGSSVFNGYSFKVKNTGNAVLTLDPFGTETIDGSLVLDILPKQECTVVWDGTGWQVFGLAAKVLVGRASVTSPTANPFKFIVPDGYTGFECDFEDVAMSNQSLLNLNWATDSTLNTYYNSNGDYLRAYVYATGSTAAGQSSVSSAAIAVSPSLAANSPTSGRFNLRPGRSSPVVSTPAAVGHSVSDELTAGTTTWNFSGRSGPIGRLAGFALSPSAGGNISGTVRLWGLK